VNDMGIMKNEYVFFSSIIIIYIIIGGLDFAFWVAEHTLSFITPSFGSSLTSIVFFFILFVGVFCPMILIFIGLLFLDHFLVKYTGLTLLGEADTPFDEPRSKKEPPVLHPIRTPAVQTAPSFEGGSISGGTITVTVPAGFQPGQQIQIKAPDGRLFLVTIPVGMQPGSQFQVNIA
tara:strand:- start:74 stop:601 length:528 start_codon:yes stop_codon:yes gene_type:complete